MKTFWDQVTNHADLKFKHVFRVLVRKLKRSANDIALLTTVAIIIFGN